MQSFSSGQFLCPEGHILTWKKCYINQCGQCGIMQNTTSRFGCETCKKQYCPECVKPPVMGDYCGGGHIMEKVIQFHHNTCDVCRQSIQGGGFRCQTCDYDVCSKCHIEKED